jgi:protein-disulfide isomerase
MKDRVTMRKFAVALVGLAMTLTLAACQKTTAGGASADDMAMGSPSAKVTMIEYASVSCPHCARFATEVFPAFKAKYIDTGQVRYVAREALTGDPAIAAAGFLTARCAGKDKYFQVVDAIYHAQPEIFSGGEPHAVLLNIARSAGMTDSQFESCIKDEAALNALNSRWEKYVKDDKINGTPTFVINGKVYDKGEMSLAELDAAVAEAKAAGKASS